MGIEDIECITHAEIKVVPFSRLEVGDEILWGNLRRRIVEIKDYPSFESGVYVTNPMNENIEFLKRFANYYVLKSYTMDI